MSRLNVFIGYDERQPIAYHVAQASILETASMPVSVTPLKLSQLPLKRTGLTPFTWSRFLVPYLCDYQGWGLFMDLDVLVMDDLNKLMADIDETKAVFTADTQPKFERAAVMLFNCAHEDNKVLTPDFVEGASALHSISWTQNRGSLHNRWNHLVGYDEPSDDVGIIHYTMGIPAHPDTADCEHADKWIKQHRQMNSSQPWQLLMGNSVHAVLLPSGQNVPRYKVRDHAA